MRIAHRLLFPSVLAALSALLLACGQSTQAGGAPQAGEPEVAVTTIAPQQVTLTTVLPGRTSAYLVSEVRPQVGGIVQKRLFKEGSDVKAGEVLYQIDPATFQAAYESARAALAKAEASAVPARLKGERYAGLSKVRAVSQQENDDAQAAQRQAEAEVLSARAALEAARINLAHTRVTAPISGRIGKSSVTPGALVTASQAAALATVQQTDQIYVDVTQSSAEVLRLKRDLESGRLKKAGGGGAKVKLLFEDGAPYPVEGALQFSDITVDQSTGVITLRAVFPNKNNELLPGLYVRAVLEEGVEEAAILVPQPAVVRDTKGNPAVMVVKPDGVVEQRPVQTGRVVGDAWLVTGGLAAGDRVIVEGLQKVRPGVKVKAVEAGAPKAEAQAGQQNATQAEQAGAKPGATPEAQKPETPKAQTPKPEQAKAEQAKAEQAKAEQAKAEAKPAAPAAPKTEKPQPAGKAPGAAAAKPGAKAPEAAADQKPGAAYSPPKDQPWPGSQPMPEAKPAADAQPVQQ